MSATKTSPVMYWLELNGSHKEVEVHQMSDGLLHLCIEGQVRQKREGQGTELKGRTGNSRLDRRVKG